MPGTLPPDEPHACIRDGYEGGNGSGLEKLQTAESLRDGKLREDRLASLNIIAFSPGRPLPSLITRRKTCPLLRPFLGKYEKSRQGLADLDDLVKCHMISLIFLR